MLALAIEGKRGRAMSTALTTALRESCEYLRDAGYHQTAQLMIVAADEIERLDQKLQTRETTPPLAPSLRNSIDELRQRARRGGSAGSIGEAPAATAPQ